MKKNIFVIFHNRLKNGEKIQQQDSTGNVYKN